MKKPSFWLKLLGSLLFVGLLTRWIDLEDLRARLMEADPTDVAAVATTVTG